MSGAGDVVIPIVSVLLGAIGGGISGDVVAKRQLKRERQLREEDRSAQWVIERLGSARCRAMNVGDEVALDVHVAAEDDDDRAARLEEARSPRVEPRDGVDFVAMAFGYSEPPRAVITWTRPNGKAGAANLSVPRSE